MGNIRLRFAPSPTGELHLGGARTALLNFVFARSQNGKLILRIEDTDITRSTAEFETSICEALKTCGIEWDEGPDRLGPMGPYRQSQRLSLYQKICQQLLAERKAYRCFFSDEEIAGFREAAAKSSTTFRLPDTFKVLSEAEGLELVRQGKPFTIRLDTARCAGEYRFSDLLKGDVSLPSHMVGDFVIFRSNMYPTYNFAAAVDDHLMGISHVLRGEEHLSNTLRQLMVYDVLGWDPPQFLHLPLIMGRDSDGQVSKLSKRHGDVSVTRFFEKGILPEALANYLLTLGYTHETELFSVEEVIGCFSMKRLSTSAALWDPQKLAWFNSQYLAKLPDDVFLKISRPYMSSASVPETFVSKLSAFEPMILYFRDHISALNELPDRLSLFFEPCRDVTDDPEVMRFLEQDPHQQAFECVARALKTVLDADNSWIWQDILARVKKETGLKGKTLFKSIRLALTGALEGPELVVLVERVPRSWFDERLSYLVRSFGE